MKTGKDFSGAEWRELHGIVFEKTGCYFKNSSLLKQAFIRRSYSARYGGENNENLEFFGDGVLDFFVRKAMAEKYGYVKTQSNLSFDGECEYAFRGDEKGFTELKKEIVSNKTLAGIIDDWGLIKFLIVDKADLMGRVDEQEKVKADLFEAILGAIAVQYKWDAHVLEKAVCKMLPLDAYLKDLVGPQQRPENMSLDSAVNTLKELSEQGKAPVPRYDITGPYDENGNPKWACTCWVEDWALTRQVWAASKRDAKKCCAYLILCEHFEMENEYGPSGKYIGWHYCSGKLIPYTQDQFLAKP